MGKSKWKTPWENQSGRLHWKLQVLYGKIQMLHRKSKYFMGKFECSIGKSKYSMEKSKWMIKMRERADQIVQKIGARKRSNYTYKVRALEKDRSTKNVKDSQ